MKQLENTAVSQYLTIYDQARQLVIIFSSLLCLQVKLVHYSIECTINTVPRGLMTNSALLDLFWSLLLFSFLL